MRKFSNIRFPIFGLKKHIEFEYTLEQIYATINKQTYIIDDKTINNDSYLSRLIELDSRKKPPRLNFDYTIRNMEELLRSDCKVAIDAVGRVHSFISKEYFKYSEREITKIRKDKYFWFKNISYPFILDFENIEEITEHSQYYYGKLVYINRVWYLLGLTDEKTNKEIIWM